MAEPTSIFDTPAIKRRAALMLRLIRSLDHIPRDHALSIILSWIPEQELEDHAFTISGDPDILKDLPTP